MRNLPLYGKVNIIIAAVFMITGILLFIQRLGAVFEWRDQYLSLSFIFLGSALFLSTIRLKKKKNN
ncbi:MAG: hypothetical protein ACQEWU_16040 [Bacillota bacterium]|uniref:Uncharacterized protein n=1 Tax=Virgibacillus salarius TaxID=447199 RepID=A0A941E252_9BACI|nr:MULTISPECIES: hypothetical protein [Bacillaceae]NAZ11036.1 hypothetical protein [Agaribacter marinus]MBR7798328.1 hypothetical protein [Virgibacillus salarius]MCC2252624.1 hypothetical protein [Virgibacillus sp. AGTR]MDY7045433.1 hypothetical protein [Virgibacillus sp. M23]QRZ16539.1 hypothetical protein JUJ52_12035 [Virgibacillus sp. AGTR]